MEGIQTYVLKRGRLQEHNAHCPQIPSDGIDRRIFWVGKFGKYFLGDLIWLSRDFGYSKKSNVVPAFPCREFLHSEAGKGGGRGGGVLEAQGIFYYNNNNNI